MEDEHAHITNYSNNLKFKEETEEEETASLCDLPLNTSISKCNSFDEKSSRSSIRSSLSDATEFFEFFNEFSNSDMCPADDIIFCGKLIPFKDNKEQQFPPIDDQTQKNIIKLEENNHPTFRRRSESLSKLQSSVTQSDSDSRRFKMRNSRSLDYQRLRKNLNFDISREPEIERNCSVRSAAQSEIMGKKAMKPRWYALMFGTMKVPTEMELNDMKNRKIRRNPSTTMFPTAVEACENVAVNRSHSKVSWRILSALSCKDHKSVAVATSFPLPQAI